MSALDGWIDVCRTGRWVDASNRTVNVDKGLLDRLAANYRRSDPAPVVVGHPELDAPAYGWIDELRVAGDRLQAKLRDLAPAFRQAVEQGRYASRSLAFSRAGTKVRHLGFLGGRIPAVDGLAPTRFSSPPEHVVTFAIGDGGELASPLGNRLRALRDERGLSNADLATAMGISESTVGQILSGDIARPPDERLRRAARLLQVPYDELRDLAPDDDDDGADMASLAAREARLRAREVAADFIDPHIKAGRVLPAERDLVTALAMRLDGGDSIQFAAGGDDVTEAPLEALGRFLGALPARVIYAELAAGPGPGPDDDAATGAAARNNAVVERARELMDDARKRGTTLAPRVALAQAEKENVR